MKTENGKATRPRGKESPITLTADGRITASPAPTAERLKNRAEKFEAMPPAMVASDHTMTPANISGCRGSRSDSQPIGKLKRT